MINFFQSHDKNKNESTRLMQAFYANWHAVAPDGNAHSQSESIGTMLQYLHGVNLRAPIMAPIKSSEDVEAMTISIKPVKTEDIKTKRRSRYGNELKQGEGYLYKKTKPKL